MACRAGRLATSCRSLSCAVLAASLGLGVLTGCTGSSGSTSSIVVSSVADSIAAEVPSVPSTTLTQFKVDKPTTPQNFTIVDRSADGYAIALPKGWSPMSGPAELDAALAKPGVKADPELYESFRGLIDVKNAFVAFDVDGLEERAAPTLSIVSQPATAADPSQLQEQLLNRAGLEGGRSIRVEAVEIGSSIGRRATYEIAPSQNRTTTRHVVQYAMVVSGHVVSLSFSTADLVQDQSLFDQIASSFRPN